MGESDGSISNGDSHPSDSSDSEDATSRKLELRRLLPSRRNTQPDVDTSLQLRYHPFDKKMIESVVVVDSIVPLFKLSAPFVETISRVKPYSDFDDAPIYPDTSHSP